MNKNTQISFDWEPKETLRQLNIFVAFDKWDIVLYSTTGTMSNLFFMKTHVLPCYLGLTCAFMHLQYNIKNYEYSLG